MFYHFTCEYSRQYVFDNLLCESWVLLAIKKWFNQAHFVSYFSNIDIVLFYYLISEKSRHYVLANLMCYSWVLLTTGCGLSGHTVLSFQQILIHLCLLSDRWKSRHLKSVLGPESDFHIFWLFFRYIFQWLEMMC